MKIIGIVLPYGVALCDAIAAFCFRRSDNSGLAYFSDKVRVSIVRISGDWRAGDGTVISTCGRIFMVYSLVVAWFVIEILPLIH
mgnify:CR=1 FL=1